MGLSLIHHGRMKEMWIGGSGAEGEIRSLLLPPEWQWNLPCVPVQECHGPGPGEMSVASYERNAMVC